MIQGAAWVGSLYMALLQIGQDAPDRAELIRQLSVRDAQIQCIELPYEVRRLEARAFGDLGVIEDIAPFEAGRWRVDRTEGNHLLAIERDVWEPSRPYQHEEFTWDGREARWLSVLDQNETDVVQPRAMHIFGSPTMAGVFNVGYYPGEFGLLRGHGHWSDRLEAMSDVQIVGREVVNGFSCVQLIYDMDIGGDDGIYAHPRMVWFDLKSLLAVQAFGLQEDIAGRFANEHPAVSVAGKRYRVSSCWRTLTVHKGPDGVWIPTTGAVQVFLGDQQWATLVVTVTASEVRTQADIAPVRFSIDPPAGTHIFDEVRGDHWIVQERGAPWVTPLDISFASLLARLGLGERIPEAEAPNAHAPFTRSSCGPNALYLAFTHQGVDIALAEILLQLPEEDRISKRTTLHTLSEIAKNCGLEAIALETNCRTLSGLQHSVAICLMNPALYGEDHFAVALFDEEVVTLATPPETVKRMSLDEFARDWTGMALIVSTQELAPTIAALQRKEVSQHRAMIMGVLGIALVSTLGAITLFRRRAARLAG